ncbi:MAG: hypothetical protein ACREBF_00035 [Candidatus Micrarchaeales archaeon]
MEAKSRFNPSLVGIFRKTLRLNSPAQDLTELNILDFHPGGKYERLLEQRYLHFYLNFPASEKRYCFIGNEILRMEYQYLKSIQDQTINVGRMVFRLEINHDVLASLFEQQALALSKLQKLSKILDDKERSCYILKKQGLGLQYVEVSVSGYSIKLEARAIEKIENKLIEIETILSNKV